MLQLDLHDSPLPPFPPDFPLPPFPPDFPLPPFLPDFPLPPFPPDSPLPPSRPVPPPPPSPSGGEVVMLVALGFGAIIVLIGWVWHRNYLARDAAATAAPVQEPRLPGPTPVQQRPPLPRLPGTAPVQQRPPLPRLPGPSVWEDERELRRACTRAANTPPPTARLPAFTYSHRSARRNVTGGGEESCSVCLAAFRLGETVRLLPVCLHLYHAECIDPWLDAHSTCPLCRSDADPSTDLSRLPPV